jgi:hypothetical protein
LPSNVQGQAGPAVLVDDHQDLQYTTIELT